MFVVQSTWRRRLSLKRRRNASLSDSIPYKRRSLVCWLLHKTLYIYISPSVLVSVSYFFTLANAQPTIFLRSTTTVMPIPTHPWWCHLGWTLHGKSKGHALRSNGPPMWIFFATEVFKKPLAPVSLQDFSCVCVWVCVRERAILGHR